MKLFWCPKFVFVNFDFKNDCKNEFYDNNEKSCSRPRKRVSHKIDFKAVWPRNGHAASVRVKNIAFGPEEFKLIRKTYFL